MEFSVLQWVPGQGPAEAGGIVWRTCLREIAFVAAGSPLPDSVEAFHDEAAYAHLLTVICGLGSPILGETEVMAQFKAFAGTLPAEHAGLREVTERLLLDARTVRARHLTGLGSRSYGSAVRRHIKQFDRVAVIGTGMLAQEILPFLPGENRMVDLWGRRESPAWLPAGAAYRRLDDSTRQVLDGRTAIVVAAPLTAAQVDSLRRYYADPALVIDLRAEGRTDPLSPVSTVITLDDVFAEMQAAAATSDQKAAAARETIRQCARTFVTRAKLNPSGWHDLCA
jgi:glutamyl-tRNA reductase